MAKRVIAQWLLAKPVKLGPPPSEAQLALKALEEAQEAQN